MPDVFIGLKEAAEFEGVKYNTLVQRIKRSPNQYKTRTQPQENGGREQVLISVGSLTAKGRKAWRAAQKIDGRDVVIEKRTESAPWYVGVDLNHYTEQHKKAFYEAVELAARVQDFIDYDGPDRTAYAERYALGLGVSLPTLYRYVDNILKANAWALKMEKEDGQSRDYFRALSLCRKPKATATFPSLTDEQKALIQNIWFDRRFAANLGTIEMLYEKFEEVAEGRGWESYPSIKTVARYVKHITDARGAESARYLAANGSREWKNKKMLKGKRDATSLKVMEYVVGDEHTFDFWVQWVAPNGKIKAVRPKLVAWMDMRSRAIVGDVACVEAAVLQKGSRSVDVLVEAEKEGSRYNVPEGQITRSLTFLNGIDGISNGEDWIVREGSDTEDDEGLRTRALRSWSELAARSIEDTFINAAEAVQGVLFAQADCDHPRGQGTVDVIVTGTAGEATEGLLDEVRDAVDKIAGPYDNVLVKSSTTVSQDIEVTVSTSDVSENEDIKNGISAILAELLAVRKGRRFNELRRSDINFAIRSNYSAATNAEIITPAEDVVLEKDKVITLGAVTVTIRRE